MTPVESHDRSMPLVGVCPDCDELFTLPEGSSPARLGCPHCDAEVAYEQLRVRGLRAAVVLPETPTVSEQPESEAAPAQPIDSAKPPTLSETLGWQATLPEIGSPTESDVAPTIDAAEDRLVSEADELLSRVEQIRASVAGEPAPATEEPTAEPPSQPTLAEFGFNFADTPLHNDPEPSSEARTNAGADRETSPPTPTPVVRDASAYASGDAALAGGEVTDLLRAAASDRPEDSGAELLLSSAEDERRGHWTGVLSATAGLVLIGGPAAFLVWSGWWGQSDTDTPAALVASDATPMPTASDQAAEPPVEASVEARRQKVADPFASATPPKPTAKPQPSGRYARSGVEAASYEVEAGPEPPAAWAPETEPASERNAGGRYATNERTKRQTPTEESSFALPAASTPKPSESATPPASEAKPPLAGAPIYSPAELSRLAIEANDQAAIFTAGSLSDPEQAPALGQAYARLCKLSEALTLLDPAVPSADRRDSEFAALDIFRKVLHELEPRESSRVIARHWIEWAQRPHGGVFFGAVPTDEPRMAGEVYRYEFELDGVVFPVVTSEKMLARRFLAARAQEVGVIGVVVESPAQRIAGYVGDDERVVWARKTMPLREAGKL